MKYRPLGQTGLKVSEIGFGTWGLGGVRKGSLGYGKTSDRESTCALRKALDLGINFYDTANLYGFGHSEILLGKFFRGKRKQVILASKAGFLNFQGKQNFSRKYIRQCLIQSLKRLQTDYLDLYQLHSPPIQILIQKPSIMDTLDQMKISGLIRSVGVSVRSPEDALLLLRHFDVDCIQANFNLTDQRAIDCGLLKQCQKMNVGFIARTPLCFGFLTTDHIPDRFKKGDHRSRFSKEQIERWKRGQIFFKKNLPLKTTSLCQNALRFCLSYSEVTTTIPGMLTTRHVCENAEASGLARFSKIKLQKLHRFYRENQFFKI